MIDYIAYLPRIICIKCLYKLARTIRGVEFIQYPLLFFTISLVIIFALDKKYRCKYDFLLPSGQILTAILPVFMLDVITESYGAQYLFGVILLTSLVNAAIFVGALVGMSLTPPKLPVKKIFYIFCIIGSIIHPIVMLAIYIWYGGG